MPETPPTVAVVTAQSLEDWCRAGRTLHNLALAHQDAARPFESRACHLQSTDAHTRANARTRADSITP